MKNLNPKNIILCTHALSNVVTFLQRSHSMGILSSDVKLILTTLVSTHKSTKTKRSFSSVITKNDNNSILLIKAFIFLLNLFLIEK